HLFHSLPCVFSHPPPSLSLPAGVTVCTGVGEQQQAVRITSRAGAGEQQQASLTLGLACSPPLPSSLLACARSGGQAAASISHSRPCMLTSTRLSPLFSPIFPVQESPRALGRSSSSKAAGAAGMSEEEAIAEQQKMFAEARAAMLNLQRPSS
ncbi:unnamed protein product, partial [Closterium sp. Yama58-4]